ncbi:LysR family transcriptional regulator [Microbacterium elymi]|uniref:LysR family transcriptional regulator n=1 Tax=Microbacterium elymi TaxID=2909587 RepID=A0ABY5NHR6_9MICO|nr:LysR family transcriptional regulator [Microbacterium elymi]UUT34649.1 LysR family transcriptional regulator [Microbacterium elymi]
MHDVTLRQLQYFVAVVDHGSVTAAAKAQHISQAALSMAVAQLENTLEADLLIRTRSKRVVPTPRGYLFAAHARRVLDTVGEALDVVADSVTALTGTLRIGSSFTLSPRLIPELITRFDREHPQVTVEFVEGSAHDIQEEVRMGRLDLCLVYSQQADDDLRQDHLADVRLHLVLPAEHPLAARTEVDVADFIELDAILLSVPPTIERLIEQAAGGRRRAADPLFQRQHPDDLLARGPRLRVLPGQQPARHQRHLRRPPGPLHPRPRHGGHEFHRRADRRPPPRPAPRARRHRRADRRLRHARAGIRHPSDVRGLP